MPRSSVILFAAAALADACRGGARGDVAYGSRQDVADVLASGGVKVPAASLACVNPTAGGMVTRAIACTVDLSASDVATLTAGLPLASQAPVLVQNDGSCERRVEFAATNPAVDVLVGKNTRVPNGVGRIEVHVVRGSPRACVEIEYPWSG